MWTNLGSTQRPSSVLYCIHDEKGRDMLTVFIDPMVIPDEGKRCQVSKTITEAGFPCDFVPQRIEKTVSWYAGPRAEVNAASDVEEEMLAVISAEDAVDMVAAYHQRKTGTYTDVLTLTEWVESMLCALPGKNLTVFIVGLTQYFKKQKLTQKQNHRQAVTGKESKTKKKDASPITKITTEEMEEASVELQLLTGCVLQHVDSYEELGEEIKRFSKAVSDKPSKKHRLNDVFSFMEQGGPGLGVSKTGEGLAKVWKRQLMQFNNFGADMAEAITSNYPSPLLLYKECKNKFTSSDAEKHIGDINVRRGAGVIATNRRIGKEQARRIYTFMTSSDGDQLIK